MTTIPAMFLFGILAGFVCLYGLKRGVVSGPILGLVRQAETHGKFWLCAVLYVVVAYRFIVAPLWAWLGQRG